MLPGQEAIVLPEDIAARFPNAILEGIRTQHAFDRCVFLILCGVVLMQMQIKSPESGQINMLDDQEQRGQIVASMRALLWDVFCQNCSLEDGMTAEEYIELLRCINIFKMTGTLLPIPYVWRFSLGYSPQG